MWEIGSVGILRIDTDMCSDSYSSPRRSYIFGYFEQTTQDNAELSDLNGGQLKVQLALTVCNTPPTKKLGMEPKDSAFSSTQTNDRGPLYEALEKSSGFVGACSNSDIK